MLVFSGLSSSQATAESGLGSQPSVSLAQNEPLPVRPELEIRPRVGARLQP
jgi:hypothetical protein